MAAVTPASQSPLNVNNYLKQLKWSAFIFSSLEFNLTWLH